MAEESEQDSINIVINDQTATFENPIYLEDERLFVPVRNFVEYLEGDVQWIPEERQVFITSSQGDSLLFTLDDPRMNFNEQEYVMDTEPFLKDNITYLPIRHAAEFLHTEVEWDAATNTASLHSVPLYVMSETDSLDHISQQFDTTVELLKERNDLIPAEIEPGEQLKVVIPSIMEEKIEYVEPEPAAATESVAATENHPDLFLLAQIIQVEAGYESFEGQVAVGSVIINRVKDAGFPNSIREVIYAPRQFPPAHNGLLAKAEPSESVMKAAKAVLNGENNVEGALYFHNPKVSSGTFWDSLTTVANIGNHRFAK